MDDGPGDWTLLCAVATLAALPSCTHPEHTERDVTASILCIDDEPAVGVILEHALSRAGHRPIIVSGVEEAMRVVARSPIDLIIADYRMPGLTGLDLVAQLEKEGYRIPVIIMTGYSSIEHAVMSIKSGAIDYLTKPIQAETLEIAVRQALEVVRL